ncbi:cysteine proteinase [Athelia psychrophila]|uniref:Ubiquitin carboxyl-terminal hydrolase n=1 Tax=Athelia psychrophila TaxID=1759441 RepID=A0A166B8L2_9AGAM|nr:cysteine proteinase [Fibularhizoctonia sp. CBS 109695]
MSGDDDSSGWQLTESDPGVFTELLKTLGVPLIFDDLYSLDPDTLATLQPLHALIFLFKYISPSGSSAPLPSAGTPDPDFAGFFAHQTVNNACATLAVLNALGNLPLPSTATPDFAQLMSFAEPLDPASRGYVVTSADWLRAAHNALSPPAAISLDGLGLDPGEKEDAYHFVVYVPVGGALYELDGLKEHAVRHGGWDGRAEGWVGTARDVVETRIGTYPEGALEFSLLALRDDPLPALQAQLWQAQHSGDHAIASELLATLDAENTKRERWAFENSLRRHNHLGLLHALLLALARSGKLTPAVDAARTKGREMREMRQKLRKGGS